MPLTSEEIETYQRDGLVIPSGFRLSTEALAKIETLYARLLEDNRDTLGFSADFILGPHLDSLGTYGVKGDPAWLDIICNPEILDLVEQLIGPDLIHTDKIHPGSITRSGFDSGVCNGGYKYHKIRNLRLI